MTEYNIKFFDINKNKSENINVSEDIGKILKTIFNHRGTFKTKFDVIKFICRKINNICGDIFSYSKYSKTYTINNEYLMNNFQIYNLRNKHFSNIRNDIMEYLEIEIDNDDDVDIFEVFGLQ